MLGLLSFTILVIGASGIIAQIILIRELMVSFYGNELSIGLVLANWLWLEAVGSFFVGKIIERAKNKILLFGSLVTLFSLTLPIVIYLTRIIKNLIGAAPGEILSMPAMFLSSLLILLPISLSHGALFTFSCNLFACQSFKENPVGKVYVIETIGTIIGGLSLPYLLIPYFSSFEIGFGVGLVNFFALFLLSQASIVSRARFECIQGVPNDKSPLSGLIKSLKNSGKNPRPANAQWWNKIQPIGYALLTLGFGSVFLFKLPQKIQRLSLTHQWRGQALVYYDNSQYGNITVTKYEEQYTFFQDGIPVINTPIPDIAFAENFVHFSLLSHPNPKKVLIISGAAGGILYEILKHPVAEVDYVELDPLFLATIKKFPTELTKNELTDPRVNLIPKDARWYLKEHKTKYDVILINLLSPLTLQLNRYFTKEFFILTKNRLAPNGIVVNMGIGSLSHLSEDLKRIIVLNLSTLQSVFPVAKVIPGEFNLFFASSDSEVLLNRQVVIERMKRRRIQTNFLTEEYIADRLSEYRSHWFAEQLKGTEDRFKPKTNSDWAPHSLFANLIYWSALSSTLFHRLLNAFQVITVRHFILGLVIILMIGIYLIKRTFRLFTQKITIPFALVSTGLVGMALNLVIVLAFQSLFGYIYHQISILQTAFITGTAIGGAIATKMQQPKYFWKKTYQLFLLFELLLSLMPLIMFLITKGCIAASAERGGSLVFLFLSVLVGTLLGLEFPIANLIYSEQTAITSTVGLLYASDLIGGLIGAILVSVILVPVLGIGATCLIAATLKLISITFLIVGWPA